MGAECFEELGAILGAAKSNEQHVSGVLALVAEEGTCRSAVAAECADGLESLCAEETRQRVQLGSNEVVAEEQSVRQRAADAEDAAR